MPSVMMGWQGDYEKVSKLWTSEYGSAMFHVFITFFYHTDGKLYSVCSQKIAMKRVM